MLGYFLVFHSLSRNDNEIHDFLHDGVSRKNEGVSPQNDSVPPPNLMVFPPKKISPSFQFVGLLGRNDVGGGDCFGHGGGRGHGHLVKWRHGGKPTKSEQPRGQGRV